MCEFLSYFRDLEDPRQLGKVWYSLEEILLVSLCAVMAGCDDWEEIAAFGEAKLDFFRQVLPFETGIPSANTFRRLFEILNPVVFQECFVRWVQAMCEAVPGVVAVDGKTLRQSFSKENKALHMVSAFCVENKMVLGQRRSDEKSNEITAIPALLAMLDIQGMTITIDAMGCQTKIAQQILDQNADYILALKGNQGGLNDDVRLWFSDPLASEKSHFYQNIDKDHGRIETRSVRVSSDIEWLKARHDWPGLESIIEVASVREISGQSTSEKRFYISSLKDSPKQFLGKIRSHWTIENSLHWTLDMVFNEDKNRSRKDHSPENFAILRHMALNLIRKNKNPKKSIKVTRKSIGWNETQFFKFLS